MRHHFSASLAFSAVTLLALVVCAIGDEEVSLTLTQSQTENLVQAPDESVSESKPAKQLVPPEKVEKFVGDVKKKLPEVLDKEKFHSLAKKLTGIVGGSKLGLKTLNLDSIHHPIVYWEAYLDTIETFIPRLLPKSKMIATMVEMNKHFRNKVKESDEVEEEE
jgi:hypothetical protein